MPPMQAQSRCKRIVTAVCSRHPGCCHRRAVSRGPCACFPWASPGGRPTHTQRWQRPAGSTGPLPPFLQTHPAQQPAAPRWGRRGGRSSAGTAGAGRAGAGPAGRQEMGCTQGSVALLSACLPLNRAAPCWPLTPPSPATPSAGQSGPRQRSAAPQPSCAAAAAPAVAGTAAAAAAAVAAGQTPRPAGQGAIRTPAPAGPGWAPAAAEGEAGSLLRQERHAGRGAPPVLQPSAAAPHQRCHPARPLLQLPPPPPPLRQPLPPTPDQEHHKQPQGPQCRGSRALSRLVAQSRAGGAAAPAEARWRSPRVHACGGAQARRVATGRWSWRRAPLGAAASQPLQWSSVERLGCPAAPPASAPCKLQLGLRPSPSALGLRAAAAASLQATPLAPAAASRRGRRCSRGRCGASAAGVR